ncbi:MAG: DNA mismatch repair endonuclease MutL [Oscillospiraceae bacterium]|nr:DNA mismatch repair endonuclease MutL [Oscillospiraceae bacterium]
MPVINVLSKNVSELIAAGEVIDRPASLVKELVENSIDSGATSISIEIMNGGISFIRVTDNGCGIAFEQLPTAFLRHATSKVSGKDDIDSIATMGFRGEALASVAAVSRVELMSRVQNANRGGSYKIEGLNELSHDESGCPNGTTIIIRDLFFNTPARLKFLKKDVSEGNAVQAVVDKLAVIHPEISFRFIRDNKPLRITNGDGQIYSSIYAIFGKQFAAGLIETQYSQNGVHVTGYVSSPHFARANRTMQYFYVNRRYIKSLALMAAVESGFRGTVPTGKFPACIINIEVDFSCVDVNIHPAKTEVRFSNENLIFDTVYFAVKNAILNADNKKPVSFRSAETLQTSGEGEYTLPSRENVNKITFSSTKQAYTATPLDIPQEKINKPQFQIEESQKIKQPEVSPRQFKSTRLPEILRQERLEESQISELKLIGELFKTYLLCQNDDDFILIDKHAAHERIRFESLKSRLVNSSQLLAEETVIELENADVDTISANLSLLSEIGFDIIVVGEYAVQVAAVPSLLLGEDLNALVTELAQTLKTGNAAMKQNSLGIFDDVLHSIACKSAIKANDKNSLDDLAALANAVWTDESIRFCPHGRPIVLILKKHEIEKMFGR